MARIRGCAASRLNLRQRLLQLAAGGVVRRVVGVERHGAQAAGVQVDRLDREPGGFKVAAHLDRPLDADCLGGVQGGADPHLAVAVGEVEVGMVIHHRHRQWLRRGRETLLAGPVCRRPVRIGGQGIAHSSSLAASLTVSGR